MKLLLSLIPSLLISGACVASAASSWSFEDATLTVQGKGTGVGAGAKEKLNPSSPLSKSVALGATDTLKLLLTATDGKKAKRPHQAFLTLTDPTTGLEESFVLSVKESGKGKVDLTHKDLPIQFLTSSKPIPASIVIGSFGSSTPYKSKVFDLSVTRDPNVPLAIPEKPVRYAAESEIHHIFRADPRSPPKIITLVFAAAVVGALPILFGLWATLGANVNHMGKALGNAPVSHALFFGSILAMEGIFFMYYTTWNLFQTLPAAAVVSIVAFLSGSRALSEVQERRLAGLR
ncbi:Oligosaccharyltransferase subunit Ribophorin II-domain-containing protein [Clohesyomyces aquaticus]|uniref:Oligosaccharyltransferase subunit Ribophorin II-domain-containing protein n=1 Tax=Clohesyomyces aquaticus TaxID=1231657 RepID=A0A1Y2ABA5_9PLEO|nr:Oligosaccharyltransferase subunit Ribophorin II-domain-containing protein [Clohesyomyces aquaticus]